MASIIFGLVILGIIVVICLLGWLSEKTHFDGEYGSFFIHVKEDVVENYHWVLLYLFLLIVVQLGFQAVWQAVERLLSVFFIFNNNIEDFDFGFSMLASFAFISFVFHMANKQRKQLKRFRNLVKVAGANDRSFISNLLRSDPSHFSETRDVPLSLILREQGILGDYVYYTAKEVIEEFEALGGRQSAVFWRIVYRDLKLLNSVAYKILTNTLIKKYPENCYFIRLNLLSMALPYLIEDDFLVLEKAEGGSEILNEYYKLALNEFYLHPKKEKYGPPKEEYPKQTVSFDIYQFEEYIQSQKTVRWIY